MCLVEIAARPAQKGRLADSKKTPLPKRPALRLSRAACLAGDYRGAHPKRRGMFGPTPAGEAAGAGTFVSCYNSTRLSNQAFQVLRKRTEQALRVCVVSEELDDVAALQRRQ
jgi:hypothetical protein